MGSIKAAIEQCSGADETIVLPYTLELDTDQIRSIEQAVEQIRADGRTLQIRVGPQIGFDKRLVEVIEDRIEAATNESRSDRNVPILTVERQAGTSEFGIRDLLALPGRLDDIGTLVPDRSGEAVTVKALLEAAELTGTETRATFKSGEDFSADVDLSVVRDNGWLVFWLDGSPLPARYGGPVRLLIPGIDDRCANVKSVDRMIVT